MDDNEVIFVIICLIGFSFFVFLTVLLIKHLIRTHGYHDDTEAVEPIYKKTKDFGIRFLPMREELSRKTIRQSNSVLNMLWRILSEIATFHDKQKQYIPDAIKALKKRIISDIAKNTSVELINRNGSRIDIYALRKAKIETIADLNDFGNDYESIYGIGKRSADAIRTNLEEINKKIHAKAKVKLSFDDKNYEATVLVKIISVYISTEELSLKAKELLKSKNEIYSLFKQAKKIISRPGAFKRKKLFEELIDIERQIDNIFDNRFSNVDEELIVPFNEAKFKTSADAWNDFKNDPIAFNKVIERFVGVSGVSYSALDYNLRGDIAMLVKNTPLDLSGFKQSLRTYQEWGSKYIICQKKTILGDEMGLGKTVEAIAAMTSLKNNGATHFMVICPLSILTNWCREIYKFSSLNYYRIYSDEKNRNFKKWVQNGGVAITTYETLNSLPINSEYNIDLLIVDEAHLIKNLYTNRSINTQMVIDHSNRVCFLTGTVLENNVDEMINLIGLLNDDVANQAREMKLLPELDSFKELVSQVYFRRRRFDVLSELPEKTEIEDWCDISDEEMAAYKDAVIAGQFMEARRVSWNVPPIISTKMEKLKNIIELAKEEGRKVLVFSFFLDTIDKIKRELKDVSYGPISGGVPSNERQKIIDRFNNAPNGSVLVCQIQSGGVGLNIQAASVVVICEPQFKPSVENQAISRSYRMGQARNVLVYHLLATNTVDERLNEILANKQQLFDDYADTSLIAEHSFQIDNSMFTGIMKQEYDRLINKVFNKEATKNETTKQEIIKSENNTELSVSVPSPIRGVSVTKRIEMVKQPWGGYLNISSFTAEHFEDGKVLGEENINAGLVGTAVDYLSRYINGTSKEESFKISLMGAENVNETELAKKLLNRITGLNRESIIAAVKLTGFDVAYRHSVLRYKPVNEINPDDSTITNILIMVERTQRFFQKYGPIIMDGFTFEGAYTNIITHGDGDFLTKDTLWDFKVIKKVPTSIHTLQILIYYLMGIHSIHPEFKTINYIGIFNPRSNMVFRYDLSKLSEETKKEVEELVIGY